MSLSSVLKSYGLKRYVTAGLAGLLEVLRSIPQTAALAGAIETYAASFGIVGLGHAALAGTISDAKLASISTFLTFLVGLSHFIPALASAAPLLQKAAAYIGAYSLGRKFAQ